MTSFSSDSSTDGSMRMSNSGPPYEYEKIRRRITERSDADNLFSQVINQVSKTIGPKKLVDYLQSVKDKQLEVALLDAMKCVFPSPSEAQDSPTKSIRSISPPSKTVLRSVSGRHHRKIVIGVAAMEVKTHSKAIQEILKRLRAFGTFDPIVFTNSQLLEEPVEKWPQGVDCLMCWFSKRFPLDKAIKFASMHPDMFCINDLPSQNLLMDRRKVYALLQSAGVRTPPHMIVDHDLDGALFIEGEDFIEFKGLRLEKPFVEKPAHAEDHNIHIYYPSENGVGGGSRRLFRKVGNRSSKLYPDESRVRRRGCFIYEKFINVLDNQDVKVYTVGLQYIHAETRKCPSLDGVVERNVDGLEVRQPTRLTEEEKDMARRIVKVTKQNVCGIDMLRSPSVDPESGEITNQIYVIDVNGWSLVKGNPKYYDYASRTLGEIFWENSKSRYDQDLPSTVRADGSISPPPNLPMTSGRELKGFVSVFRHGDRTPKQKVKMKIVLKPLLDFLLGVPTASTDVSQKTSLKSVKYKNDSPRGHNKLQQLISLIEHLLNQPQPSSASAAGVDAIEPQHFKDFLLLRDILKMDLDGIKIQCKPYRDTTPQAALLICKWGGTLTHTGILQARALGQHFRANRFPDVTAQEVSVMSNTERRVKQTAIQFTKGFLDSEILPLEIEESAELLGNTELAKDYMEEMKIKLSSIVHLESIPEHWPGEWHRVGNPFQLVEDITRETRELVQQLEAKFDKDGNEQLCNSEDLFSCIRRWLRLSSQLYNEKTQKFDNTKFSDVFDYLKYDATHNKELFSSLSLSVKGLYRKVALMADLIIPEEYGIESADKLDIGFSISRPLLKQISRDLHDIIRGSEVKTRLYFTSESHLHSLLNCLVHAPLEGIRRYKTDLLELSFLTHIVFMIYGYDNEDDPDQRNKINILFTNGTAGNPFQHAQEHTIDISERSTLHTGFSLREFNDMLSLTAESLDAETSRHSDL